MLLREIKQSLLTSLLEYNGEKINFFSKNDLCVTTKTNNNISSSIQYSKQKKEIVRKLLLSVIKMSTRVPSSYSSDLQQETDLYKLLANARVALGKLKNNKGGKCDLIIDIHINKLNAVFPKIG